MLNRILVVDDDSVSNFLTSVKIREVNELADIRFALNGSKAMEILGQRTIWCPECILLDLNMPIMNGFEFLEWYQEKQLAGTTRIVILSSSNREEDRNYASRFTDVMGYILKPLTIHHLTDLMLK